MGPRPGKPGASPGAPSLVLTVLDPRQQLPQRHPMDVELAPLDAPVHEGGVGALRPEGQRPGQLHPELHF